MGYSEFTYRLRVFRGVEGRAPPVVLDPFRAEATAQVTVDAAAANACQRSVSSDSAIASMAATSSSSPV